MQADGQNAMPIAPFDGRGARSASESSTQISPLTPQPPQIPDHELLRLIGRGAYGEVWLARNAIGTLRAVKIVHRQSFGRVEHFEREFKGLLKFEPISRSHDGLVDILQIGRRDDAGYFFYVMELADDFVAADVRRLTSSDPQPSTLSSQPESQSLLTSAATYAPRTLRSELQARGHLLPAECVTLGLKLASALEHLHTNGLVHRDIKPSNIIFVNGEPKLADIGLVTAIDDAHSLVGTAGYIPPEGPGTPQADLYSLGKVLYEIAFGKDRQEFPQLPPDLQSHPDYAVLLELNEIILKACESDPRRRYASATALSKDLTLLQRGQSVKQDRRRKQHLAVARKLGLTAMAVVIIATAFWFWLGPKRVPAQDPRVAKLYKLGQHHHSYLDPEHLKKAVGFLNQALEIDPGFVPAYIDLFEIYIWTTPGVVATREEHLEKIGRIAHKLLAINPNQAEGHAALSYCKYLERDWHGAEDEIKRAIRLNPDYPMGHSLYGYYLSLLGRTDDALPEVKRGEELDSTSSRISVLVTWFPYMASRQFDKAIEQLQRAAELDRNFTMARQWLGRCYEARSNYLAAIKEYEAAELASSEDVTKTKEFYDAWRQAFESGGERGYWEKKLADLEPETSSREERDSRQIAGCYAKLGKKEKALDELETYFDEMTVWNALKFEPLFDRLHGEPRFKALLKRARFEE